MLEHQLSIVYKAPSIVSRIRMNFGGKIYYQSFMKHLSIVFSCYWLLSQRTTSERYRTENTEKYQFLKNTKREAVIEFTKLFYSITLFWIHILKRTIKKSWKQEHRRKKPSRYWLFDPEQFRQRERVTEGSHAKKEKRISDKTATVPVNSVLSPFIWY